MQNLFVGIDISAEKLDIHLCCGQTKSIGNNPKEIKAFLGTLAAGTVIGMENTGRYNNHLLNLLSERPFKVYVIDPQHLKKSLGLVRGKNDRIDAKRICEFVIRNQAELEVWSPATKAVGQIRLLMAERAQRIRMRRQLLSTRASYAFEKGSGLDKELVGLSKALVAKVNEQIKQLEAKMLRIIKEDEVLHRNFGYLKSIPGVGDILALLVIVRTNGFTRLMEPRKMACYAGVVPFEQQSGKSLRGKPRVCHLADKTLKTILHMAAMSAVRLNNDLGQYYLRKVEAGKNKMSILNAVRNKIVHRICAVIKNQKNYEPALVLS